MTKIIYAIPIENINDENFNNLDLTNTSNKNQNVNDKEMSVDIINNETNYQDKKNEDICQIIKNEKIEESNSKQIKNKEKKDEIYLNTDEILIGDLDKAPKFMKDNEFIIKGYRINFNTIKKIIKSLFIIHNESFNIWSHILGACLSLIFLFYTILIIKSHKNLILEKISLFNDEIIIYSKPLLEYIPSIDKLKEKNNLIEYMGNIKNQTFEFYQKIEEKIENYKDFVLILSYDDCTEKVFEIVEDFKNKFKENINSTKTAIVKMSKDFMDNIDNMNIFNSFLESLSIFKIDLLQRIDSKEMEWMILFKQKNLEESSNNRISKWPIFGMVFGAIFCLSCSAVFHLFSCHCEQMHSILNRIDYAGISILIAGSCYPPYFYFFYCSSFFSIFYISFITIFSLIVFACSLKSDFNSPQKRNLRGTLFLLLGISTAAPFLHIIFFSKYTIGIIENPTLSNWLLGGVSYISGALIYMWRFPEKYWPGKFDFIGNSHNIFHFNVIIGVIFHFLGSIDSYNDRLCQVCQ